MNRKVLVLMLGGLCLGTALNVAPVQAEDEQVVESVPEDAETVPAKRIYRHIGPDGSVVFSDEPVPGAEEMRVRETNSVDMAPRFIPRPQVVEEEKAVTYTLRISSPPAGKHFQNYLEPVPVQVSVAPAPAEGLTLEVTDNGEPVPENEGNFVIPLLNRGEHSLVARLVDDEGNTVASSEPVVFYAHRVSARP